MAVGIGSTCIALPLLLRPPLSLLLVHPLQLPLLRYLLDGRPSDVTWMMEANELWVADRPIPPTSLSRTVLPLVRAKTCPTLAWSMGPNAGVHKMAMSTWYLPVMAATRDVPATLPLSVVGHIVLGSSGMTPSSPRHPPHQLHLRPPRPQPEQLPLRHPPPLPLPQPRRPLPDPPPHPQRHHPSHCQPAGNHSDVPSIPLPNEY